jgi:GT2 family glycosyltransferase
MIAICLSSYNGEQFLQEQLRSIEKQSFGLENFVLIVRDDGSTDASFSVLQDFVNYTSLNVKLLRDRTNLGVKKSFELLLSKALEADAQYIMFCDQDDVWNQDKIEKSLSKMQEMENKYSEMPLLIHGDLQVVSDDLSVKASSFWKYQNVDPKKDTFNHFIFKNSVTGCTMMINRELAKKVKKIPNEAIMHDWWIAMVASVFGKIAYIDEPLMLYRQHGGNDTGAKKYGFRYIWNRFLAQDSLDKYIQQAKCFLDLYENELDAASKQMLQAFTQFNSLSKFRKIVLLFRYKLWKDGFVRNVGLVSMA